MRLKSQFSDVVYQANNVYWQVGKFWTVLWILNDLFRIQLRMFKVPDLDPTHFIEAYWEIKKHLKINPKRRIYQLNYLSFSFSLSPESSGLKIINNFFFYLIFHSCLGSRKKFRIRIHNTGFEPPYPWPLNINFFSGFSGWWYIAKKVDQLTCLVLLV